MPPSSAALKLSFSPEPSASAPGSLRAIASTSTIAGSSPPESTYGPIEIASVQRWSTMRASNPSNRDESTAIAGLGGKLLDERLVELAALRRQRDHARGARVAVGGVERGRDDVDAQHHPRATPVRRVVDLAGAQRRRVAVVEEPQLELGAEHRGNRLLLGQPAEGVRNLGEDVEAHRGRVTVRG